MLRLKKKCWISSWKGWLSIWIETNSTLVNQTFKNYKHCDLEHSIQTKELFTKC